MHDDQTMYTGAESCISSLQLLHPYMMRADGGMQEGTGNTFEVAEMRMLRWMCGFTKLDKIRNERIRGTTKLGVIANRVLERMSKWCGQVMK